MKTKLSKALWLLVAFLALSVGNIWAQTSMITTVNGGIMYELCDDGTATAYRIESVPDDGKIIISATINRGQYTVTAIHSNFADCEERERVIAIEIPATVTNIYCEFSMFPNLTNFTVNGDNPSYSAQDGILFNKSKTKLIREIVPVTGTYEVPEGVVVIGEYAFYMNMNLTGVTLPSSLTTIEDGAFNHCPELSCVSFEPNSVVTIGKAAFYYCPNLTNLTLPNTLTTIGEDAFKDCSGLVSLSIPKSVTSIGEGAFSGCSALKEFTIDNENTHYFTQDGILFGKTDQGLSLMKAVFPIIGDYNNMPENVITIENKAFINCSDLTGITIPNSVTTIGYGAFWGCKGLVNLTIPNSVTTIGSYAFCDCERLESLTIPNSVTTIGDRTFGSCYGLKSLTIPNSVTTIGSYAFIYCIGLESLTIPNSVTTIGEGAFRGCSGLESLTIPNSVTTIGSGAFFDCSGLTSLAIPNSVTTIEGGAFYGCSGLTSLTIPNSVTTIGSNAFRGCSGLESLTIPNSVTTIGSGAFYGCSGLKNFTVDKENAYYCAQDGILFNKSMTELIIPTIMPTNGVYTIPNFVTTIGDEAFSQCTELTRIIIPNSVTKIGDRAFAGCYYLENLSIPNSVTYIGESAFNGCSNLTSVKIPFSVGFVGGYITEDGHLSERAFSDCENLREVNIDINFNIENFSAVFEGCPLETIHVRKKSDWTINGNENEYVYGFPSHLNVVEHPELLLNEISLKKEGYITAYTAYPFILPEGCQAGVITGRNGKSLLVNYMYQAGDIIPGETAVLIKGESSDNEYGTWKEIKYPDSYEGMKYASSANFLKGVLEDTEIIGTEALAHYSLSYDKDNANIGFYYAVDMGLGIPNVPANKCYLELPYVDGIPDYFLLDESDIITQPSSPENIIYAESTEGFAGKTTTISIRMKHATDVSGIQADIYLPDGFTVTGRKRGDDLKQMDDNDEFIYTFTSSLQSDGGCRITSYSRNAESMPDGDIEVAKIEVTIADNVVAGEYSMFVKNIVMAYNTTNITIDEVISTFVVNDYVVGDANDDGVIDITDVTAIQYYIHHGLSDGFNEKAADANEDGVVDITDITTLIYRIHNGTNEVRASRMAPQRVVIEEVGE